MRKILFAKGRTPFFWGILFVFLPFFLNAQNSTAFRKNYNYTIFDFPANIIEGLTANYYILAGTGLVDGIVTQLNDTGGTVWAYNYNALFNDIKKDIGNNQYFLCGSESNDAILLILDANGNVVLSKKFSISEANDASFSRVIKASDGGYVAVGYVTGYDPDGGGPEIKYNDITWTSGTDGSTNTRSISSPLIVKFDAGGNHVWHQVFRYYTAATKNPSTERIYNDASFNDVVEISDGYVAVGSYDVNEFRSVTSGDEEDDATPTDALILKTATAGAITYHRQVDNTSTSTSQSSKYLSAINTTSAGAIIAGGGDDNRELIQKFSGSGGFSNTFSRLFRYSQTFFINDPSDVSQIYEVSGSTDLVTMAMYIKPLSFFSNSIHRVNSTATSNVWAKHYDFTGMFTIIPKGSLTSDGGYISASMGAGGGANYDFHVIKTDNNGDTPLTGCPATSFAPTAQAGPTTFADPFYNSWSGTPGSNAITISKATISLSPAFVCTKISCTAPLAASTVTATPATICQGQSTTISASGSGSGVTYNVYTTASGGSSIGSTPLTVSPSSTITYYVETAQSGDPSCVSTTRTSVTVTVNTAAVPTITPGGPTSFCQGGSVTLTSSAANSYSWSNGGTSQSITVSASGSYTVTVTYANTCSNSSAAATVTVNNNPSPTITPSGATTFCQGNSVTLTSSAANSYLWSDGSTLQSINVTMSGNYNVTVTDGNGCTGSTSSSTTITVNQNPAPNISGANSVCSNGTATYSVTNSGNAFSWSVSNGTINSGQGTNSVSVTWNASGAASISITETNGSTTCTGSNTLNVTINSSLNPTITVNGPTSICQNDTVVLDAGSGYSTYLWSTNETSQTISVTSAGTYSVSVTDASGCSGSSTTPVTITVTNNPAPTITANGPTTICQGDSVMLDAGNGFSSYLWSTGETSQAIYADSTGSFSVTVTDGNGCSGSSSVATNVDVISNPVVTITSSDSTTFCQGDSITLDAGLGFTNYLWSTGDTTQTIVVDSTGNYSISVTDANGCSNDSSTTSTSVTVNPLPIAFISGNTAACDGDTVFLIASGGITYLWNTGDNDSALTATSSGIYVVSVNDSNNCSDIYSASVIVNPAYSITTPENICTGDSIFLQGNYQNTAGTYYDTLLSVNSCDSIVVTTLFVTSYSISVPDTICSGDSVFLQGNYQTISGIYVDSLSSINGCDSVVSTILTVSSYSISVADTICSGDSVFLQGNYQTTGGIYNDTLSSANGCDSIVTTILSVDSSYSVSLSGTICSGDSIFLQGNYQTLAGTYYDTLNSTGGCDSILATTLTVNPSPIISIVIDSNNLCAGDSAFLCVTPAGLNPLWSNGVLGDCFISSPPNTILYSVTVTDANSCSKSDSVLVTVTQVPVVSIAGDSITCSNEPVMLIAAGGSTYSWSTGDSDSVAVVNPTVDSTYFVTVSNGNCTTNDSAFVIVLPAPDAVNAGASPDTAIHFGDKATLSAAGNGNYFWSPSDDLSCVDCINPIANPDSTTVYYLTVTAANGCTFSDSVIVTVDYPPGDVFVPNIFSPNGDGQNDKLFVYGRYVDRIELFIYDRWGEKIFETTDKTQGWDGTYKGELLNTAVFAYYLKAYLFDGTVYEKHGNTTLLR